METQLWRKILAPYRLAVDELVVKFTHIKQQYQDSRMYSPIEMVSGRVKRVSSILEKAKRKGVNLEELEEKIEDIAGIRIICQCTDLNLDGEFFRSFYRLYGIINNHMITAIPTWLALCNIILF